MGILDGSETIRTSTGSKEINYYESNDLTDTYYWFGSDSLGRDLWTRTWSGTRISLYVAVLAVFIDLAFGLTYGLVSGYFGGKGRYDHAAYRRDTKQYSVPDHGYPAFVS